MALQRHSQAHKHQTPPRPQPRSLTSPPALRAHEDLLVQDIVCHRVALAECWSPTQCVQARRLRLSNNGITTVLSYQSSACANIRRTSSATARLTSRRISVVCAASYNRAGISQMSRHAQQEHTAQRQTQCGCSRAACWNSYSISSAYRASNGVYCIQQADRLTFTEHSETFYCRRTSISQQGMHFSNEEHSYTTPRTCSTAYPTLQASSSSGSRLVVVPD
jgi:hypothetical protein